LTAQSSNVKNTPFSDPPDLSRINSHRLLITPSLLISAKEMLAYHGGHAFDSANVEGLRKIRVSVGKTGFARETGHVTGLCLEYADSELPLILGQWIDELGSIELGPDERLTGITTWHDYTNRYNRVKFGPLIGMRFVT
jgi:hypothetical protein